MKQLLEGHRRFIASRNPEVFKRLAQGQSPEALVITCSDSRLSPDLLMGVDLGSIFVIRNAGNIVPPYDAAGGGEGATVEFAVAHLKVRDIIVLGHSHCAAAGELVAPKLSRELPLLGKWLEHAAGTLAPLNHTHCACHAPGATALVSHAAQQNVLLQLQHLRTYPRVQAAIAAGTCRLHGWFFDLEAGVMLAYDARERAFMPLLEAQESAQAG